MKTNKYIVAFDMLPLSKERLESWDYNSMIFFKMFGNPILDIDKNVVDRGKKSDCSKSFKRYINKHRKEA